MRYLKLRKEARRECLNRMKEILDKCSEGDNARDMNEEERAEYDQLREMVEGHDEVIRELAPDEERMEDNDESRSEGENDRPGDHADRSAGGSAAPSTSTLTRELPPTPDLWRGRAAHLAGSRVTVRNEPTTYGDREGLQRFLVDLAITNARYQPSTREYEGQAPYERMNRHMAEMRVNERDTLTSNLSGIVIPMFDPAYVSRGIYEHAVAMGKLNNRPLPAKGDSITLPRVTTEADAAVQTEGSTLHDTAVATSAVKADLYTIAAKAPISVQAVERGYMATELLQDEMIRAWAQRANRLVLYGKGSAATPDEPLGLLMNDDADPTKGSRASQFKKFDDASPSYAKYLDYLTTVKGMIFGKDKRRPDAHFVNEDVMTGFETVKTSGGEYVIPPFAAWAQNVGGAGTLPAVEGPASEMTWRRVPVFVDTAIGDKFDPTKANEANPSTGTQSLFLSMVSDEVPIFHDGPRSFEYDQTLAASGEHLLVCRGYAMFEPMWRPEAWLVAYGTGLKLVTAGVAESDADTDADSDDKE